MKKVIFSLFISILMINLLIGCSNSKTQITIDNKDFAKNLIVERMEDNVTSDEFNKEISNTSEIEEVLGMVDDMKVQKADKNASEILKTNQSSEIYVYSFFKEKIETGKIVPYAFIVLEDGTFIYTHDKVNSVRQKPLISVEKHKDMVNDLKDKLEINF